jgi:hypothetical protein
MLKGELHTKDMQEVHDAPIVGHYGEKITKELLGKTFYWPKTREDIQHYIYTCIKCQSTKSVHKKKFELYKPLPIASSPFETVSMDFMTCLLEWEGMDAILMVVDSFLKLTKFALAQTNAMVVGITKFFYEMWVRHKGMLEVIVSECDMKLTLEF